MQHELAVVLMELLVLFFLLLAISFVLGWLHALRWFKRQSHH